jgi:ribose transport system substrate-binding protein
MIADMRAGVIHATVIQDPFRIGFEAVKSLADKLNGLEPPYRQDLQARVIGVEDLDDPEVRQILSPDMEKFLHP